MNYAKKNLALVKVDFPMRKRQSEALKKANEALKDECEIEGFPTTVVLDSEGKKLAQQAGYLGESVEQMAKDSGFRFPCPRI